MRTHLVVAMGLALGAVVGAAVGCASEGGPPAAGEQIGAESSALFVDKTPHFYTVRRDALCTGLCCEGWYVKEVNTGQPELYVSGLDFAQAGFSPSVVLDAPAADLLLYGTIEPPEGAYGRRLLVLEARRGMPGFTAAPGDAFYDVYCLDGACAEARAWKVQTGEVTTFQRLSVARATAPHASGAWLMAQVQRHGATVAGTLSSTPTSAEGAWGITLDASQVFVHMPYVQAACWDMRECAEPLVAAYTRDTNLCLEFEACVKPSAFCPQDRPTCAPGYTLTSWQAEPRGCQAFACDPAFIHE